MSAANNRRPQPSALGPDTILIYALVGLAGLWCVTLLFRDTEDNTGHAPHTA